MSLHLRGTCPQESCRSGALRACIDAKGESVQRGVWRCVSYGGRVVRLLQDPLQVNACVFEVMDTNASGGWANGALRSFPLTEDERLLRRRAELGDATGHILGHPIADLVVAGLDDKAHGVCGAEKLR